jgi:23S rRNA (guanosine2251-2'-O)-methyltransferase
LESVTVFIQTPDFIIAEKCIVSREGTGISRLLQECCDGMAAIPSIGRIDSLNVSVAAGVLFYEVQRQRRQK